MLTLLAQGLSLIGLALLFVGVIGFVFSAFRQGILWGLGVMLLPFVSLVFLVLHWNRAKGAFFLQLWGIAFFVIAALISNNDLPWPLG